MYLTNQNLSVNELGEAFTCLPNLVWVHLFELFYRVKDFIFIVLAFDACQNPEYATRAICGKIDVCLVSFAKNSFPSC